jgi:hypothetical protein
MSTTFDLSALVAAAAADDCTAHLHLDNRGNMVFSISSEILGTAEFSSYTEAMEFIADRTTYTAGDFAELTGNSIATSALNAMLDAGSQAKRYAILKAAILDLDKFEHPERSAGGFALALVNVIEIGLKNLPKGGEQ